MIAPKDRMKDVRNDVERGQPVDWSKLGLLQSIDVVVMDQQFVEEAIKQDEQADERVKQLIGS